jgi:hypothetical protein
MTLLRARFQNAGEKACLPLSAVSAPKDSGGENPVAAMLLTRLRAVAEAPKTAVIPIGT